MKKPDNLPGGPDPAKPQPLGHLPDVAVCRARHNFATMYECLVYLPYGCPHVLTFGYSFFCQHPDRAAIAARTKPAA